MILGLQMIQKQFWDLMTGKNGAQTFRQIWPFLLHRGVKFGLKFAQHFFLSLNLKTAFGSSEGLISRLQMRNKWSPNSNLAWVQTHFFKAWFFMKMASSEAVLRLRSTFLVPNGEQWVCNRSMIILVFIGWELRRWEPLASLLWWIDNPNTVQIYNINNLFLTCVKLSDAFGTDKPIFLSTFLIIPVQLILNDFCLYIITGYVIGFYIKQSGKRLPQFHTIFGRSSGTRLCSTVLPRPARKPICINRTTTSFTFCINAQQL